MWNIGIKEQDERRNGWKKKWDPKLIHLACRSYGSNLQWKWGNHEPKIDQLKIKKWSKFGKTNRWKNKKWAEF